MARAVCAAGVVGVVGDCGACQLGVYLVDAGWYVETFSVEVIEEETCANVLVSVIALVLTITNTLAFSRCDKFSQATGFASNAMYGSGLARNLAGGMISGLFRR